MGKEGFLSFLHGNYEKSGERMRYLEGMITMSRIGQ